MADNRCVTWRVRGLTEEGLRAQRELDGEAVADSHRWAICELHDARVLIGPASGGRCDTGVLWSRVTSLSAAGVRASLRKFTWALHPWGSSLHHLFRDLGHTPPHDDRSTAWERHVPAGKCICLLGDSHLRHMGNNLIARKQAREAASGPNSSSWPACEPMEGAFNSQGFYAHNRHGN